ncbi:MAG TPA: hypothetical protein VLC07_06585, partial [Solirubrobacterales bacterium]|nr:hypothetical protein [Solirubrobacterales bacterium]
MATVAFLLAGGSSASAACPNEAIREEQSATALPECRAYEKVSPDDKNGGDVVGDGSMVIAAVDGAGVAYSSRVGFGNAQGSGVVGQTQYLARRGASGWNTRAVTPTSAAGTEQILSTPTVVFWFSPDLIRGLLFGFDLPAVTDDLPEVENM